MGTFVTYLLPWEFSPTVFLACVLSAIAYSRGVRRLRQSGERVSPWQSTSFFLGLLSGYAVLQTDFDYLAQHMFWVHRLQHLILHHIAPVLMIAGAPGRILTQGVPAAWRPWARDAASRLKWLGYAFRFVQHPATAALLFVGLIYFWLIPAVHFTAMLDARRYRLMNWSMMVDGLLFWWLILTPRRARGSGSVGYGMRILMLCFVALLQIFIGAYITLHKAILFDVYAICGRAWAISPLVDQQLGGLLTWIPAAMMSGVGLLIVLHHVLHDSRKHGVSLPAPLAVAHTEADQS
jgi:putative membrane protein